MKAFTTWQHPKTSHLYKLFSKYAYFLFSMKLYAVTDGFVSRFYLKKFYDYAPMASLTFLDSSFWTSNMPQFVFRNKLALFIAEQFFFLKCKSG